MADEYSEVSSESWFGRIGDSIKGILFGIILIPLAVLLLSWNEGRAVTTAKSLKEGAGTVVSVEASPIFPANEKKLVHVNGEATTTDFVSDPIFAISAPAIRLSRTVEMYQWKENEKSETTKKLGGGTETVKTFSYEKTWSKELIDSSKFKHRDQHANPGGMLAQNFTIAAPHVMLGAFKVPTSVIRKMNGDEVIAPSDADLAKLNPDLKSKAKLADNGFYFGSDPSAPTVGDQRVTFKVLKPAVFSVLAQQIGDTFAPYPTQAGREIERVESGTISATAMFQHAASENAMLTWGLRVLGFIVMSLGIGLILNPISVFGDVIPFLGSILGTGVALASIMLGMAGSLITIAVAWFVVRPVLSGTLLALALASLLFGRYFGSRRAAATKTS